MKVWDCIVIRKQKWEFSIEAETADEAKEKADVMACHEAAHDDWAYDTTAEEDYSAKPSKKN